MHSRERIGRAHEQNANATRTLTQLDKRLLDKVASIEADGGLADSQKKYLIAAARERDLPEIIKTLHIVEDTAKDMLSQQPFYGSKEFLLSQAVYSTSPSSHAQIAAWNAQRLAAMSPSLLALTAQNARAEGELALFASCVAARTARGGDRVEGDEVFSLDALVLPDQRAVLSEIATAQSNRIAGEQMFSEAAGTRPNPVRKLQIARE